MKNHTTKTLQSCLIIFASTSTLMLTGLTPSQAQDNAFGANRRVSATGGYGGITGTFSEPTFATINQRQYSNGTKPEMYVGVSFRIGGQADAEVDAGVTFSHLSQTDRLTGRVYPAQTWFGFRRITVRGRRGNYLPVRISTGGNQWRVRKGRLSSVDITGSLRPTGAFQVALTHGSNSYFKTDNINWRRDPRNNRMFRADVISDMVAKRVIAVTQNQNPAGDPFYDGFMLTDAGFSGGEVARLSQPSAGVMALGAYQNWNNASTRRNEFLPFGRNADPTTSQPTGPFVIDLDPPHQRSNNTGLAANSGTLYADEVVNINLSWRPTVVGGRGVRRGNILNQY